MTIRQSIAQTIPYRSVEPADENQKLRRKNCGLSEAGTTYGFAPAATADHCPARYVAPGSGPESDVVGAFAFHTSHRIGQRLKRDERRDARAADKFARAIFDVILREAKKFGRSADVRSGNQVQFVRAQRLVRVNEAIDAV